MPSCLNLSKIVCLISLATLVFLRYQSAGISFWQVSFAGLMVLAAASSSLSNWMDRNTVLTLKADGVHFRNGLRDISINWDKIKEVQVLPSRFGKRVQVFGNKSHFNFRTSVEITQRGGKRTAMGFAQGDFILQQIIKNSSLEETGQNK